VNLDFEPADLQFRNEARAWLHDLIPSEPRPSDGPEMRAFDTAWQRTMWAAGWAGISWPVEYGGRGLDLLRQLIWLEEYALAGAPELGCNFVGVNHAGPTLIARASETQRTKHLSPILRGDEVWCQGFSEPGAGSDLASLRTRGVIDGEELVISGQKIWTSFAAVADWQELLIRTDNTELKHKGITWVICDMHTPGIDVRPITSMCHDNEFAEVFYDEVRVPLANVVGDINDGWSVAMSTLSFERGTGFTGDQIELARRVEDLIELARVRTGPDGRRPMIADDEIARRLGTARAEVAAMRALTYAAVSRNAHRATPGPDGSLLKVFMGDLYQRIAQLALDILGPDALRFVRRELSDGWSGAYLRAFAATIGGGTSEIQRNIIGERMLKLPR
jgi:alkylation response protein AidB-like acyl-CoA dehydrogenase